MKKSSSPKIWVPAIVLTGAMLCAAPASAGTPSALNFSTVTTTSATTTAATNTLGSTNTQVIAQLLQLTPAAQTNAKNFAAQIHHSGSNSVLSFPTQPAVQNQASVFNLESNAKQTGMVGVPTSALFSPVAQVGTIDPNDTDQQIVAQMISSQKTAKDFTAPAPILLSPLQAEYVAKVQYDAAQWAQTPEGQAAITNSASAQSAAPDARTEINEILNH